MTGPLAHAGHWLVNLAYIAPLVFLIAVIGWGKLKERRTPRADGPTEQGGT